MIVSIFLAAATIAIGFWCAPYLEGADRIVFGIFLFILTSVAIISAVVKEYKMREKIELLEQKAIKTFEWATSVMEMLRPMVGSIQTHEEILEEICNDRKRQ